MEFWTLSSRNSKWVEGESQSMEFGPYQVAIVNGLSPSLSRQLKNPKSRKGSMALSGTVTVTVLNVSYLPNSHQIPGPSSIVSFPPPQSLSTSLSRCLTPWLR
ncbi:hypothetical protein SLA2020_471730 [Shorea laevis]